MDRTEAGGPTASAVRGRNRMGFNIARCEDALAAMRKMDYQEFDLALVDAPYGRKEHGGRDRRKLVKQRNGNRLYVSTGYYPKKEWDNAPCGKEYFDEIFRVSKHQIIFGINYFPICCGPGRIVWDKCNDGSAQSDCEIAYNSMTERVDIFRFMWRGMMQGKSIEEGTVQQGNKALNERRIHPCQKPVAIYTWILRSWAKEGWTVLDPFLGSGSRASGPSQEQTGESGAFGMWPHPRGSSRISS